MDGVWLLRESLRIYKAENSKETQQDREERKEEQVVADVWNGSQQVEQITTRSLSLMWTQKESD